MATQYKGNRKEFDATAKYWTECYAGEVAADAKVLPPPPPAPAGRTRTRTRSPPACCVTCVAVHGSTCERPRAAVAQLTNLMAMGFDEESSKAALAKFGDDENAAVNFLLGG